MKSRFLWIVSPVLFTIFERISLITRFAIDFENTYLRWLHETLAFVEENLPQNANEPSP